jgi:hypothetical protein
LGRIEGRLKTDFGATLGGNRVLHDGKRRMIMGKRIDIRIPV